MPLSTRRASGQYFNPSDRLLACVGGRLRAFDNVEMLGSGRTKKASVPAEASRSAQTARPYFLLFFVLTLLQKVSTSGIRVAGLSRVARTEVRLSQRVSLSRAAMRLVQTSLFALRSCV